MMGEGRAVCDAQHGAQLAEHFRDKTRSIVRGHGVRGTEETLQMQESIASGLRGLIWAREEDGEPSK